MGKIVTADNLRGKAGARSLIKISKHEGVLRRPTEAGLDGYSPKTNKTPEGFRKERAEREAAEKAKLRCESERG